MSDQNPPSIPPQDAAESRGSGSAAAWCLGALGFILLIVSLAITDVHTGFGLVAGFLMMGAAGWDLYSPSAVIDGAVSIFTFFVPWFGGFAGNGAAWVFWIIAILGAVCTVWSWASHPTGRAKRQK